jgi:hypothetical protein
MSDFYSAAKFIDNAEDLADLYLRHYFKGQTISYPINPFQMLVDEGVNFAIRDFGKLEGVYVPAKDHDDIPIVGINLNRPITRQRFTAAHELCHYFRDSKEQACPTTGKKSAVERFADNFASGLLMPLGELRIQVRKRGKSGFHNVSLYEGLIDSYEHALRFNPNEFALNVFQNSYIYNDSRMEGVDIDIETAAEIVTDIRLSKQSSKYCTEENEAFLSIAGHSAMYSFIFELPLQDNCSVFDMVSLHRRLYSYFPSPEYGGQFRCNNTLVLGAKFETVDHKDILNRMIIIDERVKTVFEQRAEVLLRGINRQASFENEELSPFLLK